MKKLLLLSAIALASATAGAQNISDYYSVSYEGKTLENGGTIIAENWDSEAGWYHADVEFMPKAQYNDVSFTVVGEYTGTPTASQWRNDVDAWGSPSICWASGMSGNCETTLEGNDKFADFTIGNEKISKGEFTVQFHVIGQDGEIGPDFNPMDPSTWPAPVPPTETSEYVIKVTPKVNGSSVGTFTYTVFIGPDAENAGVDDITVDNDAPVVYYDLAGRKIQNPAKGQIVIERQGSKARKVVM